MAHTEVIVEPGRQDIVLRRVFDAPRDVVFKAFVDPSLTPQWWGPRQYETIVDHADVRQGGSWRFLNRDADGEYAFHGVFHDITAPERVVQTFEFEGMPGHVALETAVFEERPDGTTLYIGTSVFQSVEDRDGMAASGMEDGLQDSHARFDELLAKLR
ncbi:MAG TPA: SRPBCC family protein [Streptosporangiaceae bacterium]|jgi:uncharacterized protein YndB with AHSA1/START domain